MKVQLIDIDNRMPNLALMKLSKYHKGIRDKVRLTNYLAGRWGDVSYASCMFDWNARKVKHWMIGGGPGFDVGAFLPDIVERSVPDYSLYPGGQMSYGYTFKGCPRRCGFCKVKDMKTGSDFKHYSIWDFHDRKFKVIGILNNNTFFDPLWRETFKEIWAENLIVHDHNGYDIRLMDEEKLHYLERTRWNNMVHFAWDRMEDEKEILSGLEIIKKTKLKRRICFYILVGWKSTIEEDLHRINIIRQKYGFFVWVMPFKKRVKYIYELCAWANNKSVFSVTDWEHFDIRRFRKHGKDRVVKFPYPGRRRVHRRAFEAFYNAK